MVRYLKMLAFVLLYLGVFFIIENFTSLLYSLVYILRSILSGNSLESLNSQKFESAIYSGSILTSIISAFMLIPIFWFVLRLRKIKPLEFCGFSKIGPRTAGLAAILGTALIVPINFIVGVLSIDDLSPSTEKIFNIIFEGNSLPVLIIGIGIIGPIMEEILCRGLVLNELRKNMPVAAAVIIQGLLFGAMHMNWTQFLYAAPLGILFGVVYVWTRSIWSTILIHIFFNGMGIILGQFISEKTMSTGIFTLISFAVALVVGFMIWRGRKAKPLPIMS